MKRIFYVSVLLVSFVLSAFSTERGKQWYGVIPSEPGDEKFQRIYVKDGTLFHEDGREVALWGVNFQSAMSWEWSRGSLRRGRSFDSKSWKAISDRAFDEIQRMGCEVIRIHLCPDDYVDGQGNLIETEWLDMLDYTMAECHRRGLYINLSLINSLVGQRRQVKIIKNKEHKWEVMVLPEKIKATENYIRQLVNRKNPYDHDRVYKEYPGWIIAEIFNEPDWPESAPSKKLFPEGVRVYEEWLSNNGQQESSAAWKAFKTESFKTYINRMDKLLFEERVPAVSCWNLYWSQGPIHQGWEAFDAAAESTIPMVSFATYPGQDDSMMGVRNDLSDRNYLPYLKDSYQKRDWQGWLQEDRFKGRKASIVYEFEAWHKQSSYIYPAMAKYFRAQGAQVATMWTYYLYDNSAGGLSRYAAHNLNLVTTPGKAASFLVAGQVFKHTPRYTPYKTTEEDADRFGNAALSFPLDLSAYADEELLFHSGDLPDGFLNLPQRPKMIAGYGSSPFIRYNGKGIYFLEAVFENGKFSNRWTLKVMPHAVFDAAGRSVVDREKMFLMTLLVPGMDQHKWQIYRIEGGRRSLVQTEPPSISFNVKPGDYEIVAK